MEGSFFGIRERKELMGGKCAMNLRPKLRCASRFLTTRKKQVLLRELLFIVRWLGAGLLLDKNLGT